MSTAGRIHRKPARKARRDTKSGRIFGRVTNTAYANPKNLEVLGTPMGEGRRQPQVMEAEWPTLDAGRAEECQIWQL